jgi:hypothetical protein
MADSGVIGMYESEDGQVIEYCEIIQNIIKLDYRRFDVYIFDVRWFKDVMGNVPQCSIKAGSSGFTTIDSTRLCNAKEGTFILLSHCEQVLILIFIIIYLIAFLNIYIYDGADMHFFWIICCVMQAIFQPILHNEKWWYVIPMAPPTRLVFHTLLLADSNMAALDLVVDADPNPFDDDGCLQNVDYNHADDRKPGADPDDDVENDPDLEAEVTISIPRR